MMRMVYIVRSNQQSEWIHQMSELIQTAKGQPKSA